jgi:hypothetical protein
VKSIVQILAAGVLLTATITYVPAIQPVIKRITQDSIVKDSIKISADTVLKTVKDTSSKKKKKPAIEAPVVYSAKDTMEFDLVTRKVYLQNEAKVNYQKIELKASHIELDMAKQQVYAVGAPDTSGKIAGKPEFKEGSDVFNAEDLIYNFKTKKGFIHEIKTKQGEGTLISSETKRMPSGHIHMRNGKYSTCDLDHPHFYLALTKATAIPDDKIVAGPSYIVVEDIPLPIGLPFGFFPNTKKAQSGIVIPTFGEESTRGFFIQKGGYYWYINDYIDARILGDFYSLGSWGLELQSNYRKRYSFSGSFDIRYNYNIATSYTSKDYAITWTHSQDTKANPYQRFSASVNLSSSTYDYHNLTSLTNTLNNRKTSSISYMKSWPTNSFNLTVGLNHSQNSLTKDVSMTLPNMSFSTGSIYPFRRKESEGTTRWYENIQINYSPTFTNTITTKDSLLGKKETWTHSDAVFNHSIPLSTSIKLFQNFTISPSLNYVGVAYNQTTEYKWDSLYLNSDGSHGQIDTIKHYKPVYGQAFYPSISASFTPKIYGMFTFRNSKVQAIRHVMSPSATFSFTPDVSSFNANYYRYVQIDSTGRKTQYSIFGNHTNPTPGSGKSASISLSLRNTLEMKVLKSDTSSKAEKVKLLNNFDFSTNYNVYTEGDSMHWNPVNFLASTQLFKGKVGVNLNATLDPYAIDKKGYRYNKFQWEYNRTPFRITSASLSIATSFSSAGKGNSGGMKAPNLTTSTPAVPNNAPTLPTSTATQTTDLANENFDIPWNVSINYSWSYSKSGLTASRINTLNLNGGLSLTKNWKITAMSGIDLEKMQITASQLGIIRDLHCWTMQFSWVPFGSYQSYYLTLHVKSTMLSDLKYDKRSSPYDNYIFK